MRRERRDADLPSRVADNLFWLGRHAERAEHTVRLLRSLVAHLTREDTTEDVPELVGACCTCWRIWSCFPRAPRADAAARSSSSRSRCCSGSEHASRPRCASR